MPCIGPSQNTAKLNDFVGYLFNVPFQNEKSEYFQMRHFFECANTVYKINDFDSSGAAIMANELASMAWTIYKCGITEKEAFRQKLIEIDYDFACYYF